MKNLIICFFFSFSFLLGNSAFADLSGGTIATVIAPKTGEMICSFHLPSKENKVEVIVTEGKGVVVYAEISSDLTIILPSTLSGDFYVTVKHRNFVSTKKITL